MINFACDRCGFVHANRVTQECVDVMRGVLANRDAEISRLQRDVGDLNLSVKSWSTHAVTSDKQLSDTLKERNDLRAEVSRLGTELKRAREVVCYRPCEKHMGLPLTLTATSTPPSVREVCPHCEPAAAKEP